MYILNLLQDAQCMPHRFAASTSQFMEFFQEVEESSCTHNNLYTNEVFSIQPQVLEFRYLWAMNSLFVACSPKSYCSIAYYVQFDSHCWIWNDAGRWIRKLLRYPCKKGSVNFYPHYYFSDDKVSRSIKVIVKYDRIYVNYFCIKEMNM